MNEGIITKNNSNTMKGIGALLILLHHIIQYIPSISKYYVVTFGYSFVGIFFLISGYGITKSKRGLISRIIKIYSYFLLALILYLILFKIFDIPLSTESFFKSLIGLYEVVNFSWYIFEIIILYVMYFINEKLFKGNLISLFVMVLTMFLILFALEVDMWFYMSLFMFPIGVFISKYENIKTKKLNNILILILFILVNILLVLFNSKTSINFKFVNMILYLLHIILFNYLFIIICKKINIHNKLVLNIFNISTFIYLTQGIVIRLLIMYEYNTNLFIFIPCSIIGTFVLAYILNDIYNLITKKLLTLS